MIFDNEMVKLEELGVINPRSSSEIGKSSLSIGFECLDRQLFDPEKCYTPLAATGIKHARCQTGWNRCEREKNHYDFKWLDEVVDNLLCRGIKPWFNVGYGNKLYMTECFGDAAVGWVPLYFGDETLQAWVNYIVQLTKHFNGRVDCYEIWNESNLDEFWYPKDASPEDYIELTRISAEAIHSIQPNARIGVCVTNAVHEYSVQLIKKGVAKYIDFFCIHPYRVLPENDSDREIASLRRLLDETGGDKVAIWQGEVGYCSQFPRPHFLQTWSRGSELQQAKWLLRRFIGDLAMNLEISSFFQMADMAPNKYHTSHANVVPGRHGLLNGDDYSPKKSYYAIRNLAALFDAETPGTALNSSLDIPQLLPKDQPVSKLALSALRIRTFCRRGYGIYAYYLAEDVQMDFKGWGGASLMVADEVEHPIERPILIDPLSGKVYRIKTTQNRKFWWRWFNDLPLTDYPLVVTDLAAFEDRITIAPKP